MATEQHDQNSTSSLRDAQPRLLTYKQLEDRYGIKVATAVGLVRSGRMPHVRFGRRFIRFDVAEIERWIAEHSVTSKARAAE